MAEATAPRRPLDEVKRGPSCEQHGKFPKTLPYASEQILDDEFYPGPIDER